MSQLITTAKLKAIFVGLSTVFNDAYTAIKPEWPKLAMRTVSTKGKEVYGWLGQLPGMRELIGDIHIHGIANNDYEIVNKEFELTVGVSRADVMDGNIASSRPLTEHLGAQAARHPDFLIGAALSAGFTAKDYTGKPFFAADKKHDPSDDKSAKFTNKTNLPLTADSFNAGRDSIRGLKGKDKVRLGFGRTLVLVVPPALEKTAKLIVEAAILADGSSNVDAGTATVHVCFELESDTAWFLLDVGNPIKPLIFQEREKTIFTALYDEKSQVVFEQKKYLYQAYRRCGVGYGLPQLGYGSTGDA